MIRAIYLLILLFGIPFECFCQIQMPQNPLLFPITQRMYISPNGNDSADGSAEFPKRTFNNAVESFTFRDDDKFGNTYCEIILLEGTYYLKNGNRMTQTVQQWRKSTPNGMLKKNVSLRGEGKVVIKGDSLPPKSILVLLMGSGISVKNLLIENGTNSALILDGSEITHHSDVVIENVVTRNMSAFGILVKGYDRVLVQNSTVQQTCKGNEFEINNTCQWASGLRTTSCSNVQILSCTVEENWGEGINLSYTTTAIVRDNKVKDNYSANIYLHSASSTIVSHNSVEIENPIFWRYCYGAKGTAASIGIANELTCENACFFPTVNYNSSCGDKLHCCAYTDYDNPILKHVGYKQIDSIYVFNNIIQGSGISIWDAFSGLLNFGYINNVFVENNTFVGIEGTDSVRKGVIEFNLNTPFVYSNSIVFRNNIVSYDENRANSASVRMYVPTGNCNGDWKNKLSFTSNLWKKTPSIDGISFQLDKEESLLPISINFTDFTAWTPTLTNVPLVSSGVAIPYITDDFFHKPRLQNSNVGAIEFVQPTSSNETPSNTHGIIVDCTNGVLTVKVPSVISGKNLEVFSSLGILVKTEIVTNQTMNVPMNDAPKGVYFLRIEKQSIPFILW
jgi:parallel beta-helix repeat protein